LRFRFSVVSKTGATGARCCPVLVPGSWMKLQESPLLQNPCAKNLHSVILGRCYRDEVELALRGGVRYTRGAEDPG
jgi:hypothetical protein